MQLPTEYTAVQIPKKWREAAVVLLDHRTSLELEVDPDANRVKREDVKWIRVNRKSPDGMERVQIHWNKTYETPVQIEAEAYYQNGQGWSLSSDEIESEKDPFSNSVEESFLIPAYAEGVIIKLTVTRQYLAPEFHGTFTFADGYPTLSRTIDMTYPKDVELVYGVENNQQLDINSNSWESNNNKMVTLETRNIDAFEKKSATPYPEVYYSALHVSFPPKGRKSYTWQQLGDLYLDRIGKAFDNSTAIQEMAKAVETGTAQQNIRDSFQAVVDKFRYHGDWNGRFSYYPRSSEVIAKNGYGDCKELATLLKTLLFTKGIDSHLVLLATWREFQPLAKYPSLHNFNHVILFVDKSPDGSRFLDPTHFWTTADDSYYASIGRRALILMKGASHLEEIQQGPSFVNRVETEAKLVQDARTREWRVEGKIRLLGYPGQRFYESLQNSSKTDHHAFAKTYLLRKFDIHADQVNIGDCLSDRVVLTYSASFQENYLTLGKGGMRLDIPSLYKSIVKDSLTEKTGPDWNESYDQRDTWILPYSPASSSALSFSDTLARGTWRIDGVRVTRTYHQETHMIDRGSTEVASWFEHTKSFSNSIFWQ